MPSRQEQHRVNERLSRMREDRGRRDAAIYSRPCPTCFAAVGERCITKNGGRTAQHVTRKKG